MNGDRLDLASEKVLLTLPACAGIGRQSGIEALAGQVDAGVSGGSAGSAGPAPRTAATTGAATRSAP